MATEDFEREIGFKLMDYNAENLRFQQHNRSEIVEKHRLFFIVKEKELSIKLWDDLHDRSFHFHPEVKHIIYLSKPEELYVKYGDIEAAKYYEELKLQEQ